MIGLFGAFAIAIMALLVVSAIEYYGLFKKVLPKWLYAIIVVVINAATVYGMLNLHMDDDNIFFRILSFLITIAFVVGAYSSVLYLIKYVVLLVLRIIRKSNSGFGKTIKSNRFRAAALLLTAVMGVVGYINMSVIHVNEYEITTDKLAAGTEYTFAVVTDAHLGTGLRSGSLDEMVEKINAQSVDAVLFVGDLADNRTPSNAFKELPEALSKLQSTYGTFYVDGNHDGSASWDVSSLMKSAGVTVLRNETYALNDDITLYGVKDNRYGRDKDTTDGIMLDDSTFNLVMSHIPSGLSRYAEMGGDLTVCGHTHGEQFPLMYPIIAASNDVVEGLDQIEDMDVFVSTGIGGWGLHFSLPSRKEIAVVKVKSGR